MTILNKNLFALIIFLLTTPLIPQPKGPNVSVLDIGSKLVADSAFAAEKDRLPDPHYLTDDLQYFPPGKEFKLSGKKPD